MPIIGLQLPFTVESATMALTLVNRNVFPRDAMFEAVLLYLREISLNYKIIGMSTGNDGRN